MNFFLIYESFKQALNQLMTNVLRSLLSLTGIAIGVFCIISVLASIYSLENVIKSNFESLGEDVLYIDKIPWKLEDPSINYWKYLKRPSPNYHDFLALKKMDLNAEVISYAVFLGRKILKYRSNEYDGGVTIGVSYDYGSVFNVNLQKGRYFTKVEYQNGNNIAIIGHGVAQNLYGNVDPINKEISVNGIKIRVVGVIEKSGESMFNPIRFDKSIILPITFAKNITKINSKNPRGSSLNLKSKEGINKDIFKQDVTGALRRIRKLKPLEENNFAVNELSLLNKIFDDVFAFFNKAAWFIGIFSLLVGGFGVANIMFVNVKERVSQIGLKKALGAKSSVILLEFIFESIFLSLFGGLIGLLFVFFLMQIAEYVVDFAFILPLKHVIIGLALSLFIGVVAGLIPAFLAAKMDPIEAIRK